MKDEYTRLDTPSGTHLEPCPCCGSAPEVWQYIDAAGDATKVVMCTLGDPIGPQNGLLSSGCPLYFPSMEAYRATVREAVKYWNEFAKALAASREDRIGLPIHTHRQAKEKTVNDKTEQTMTAEPEPAARQFQDRDGCGTTLLMTATSRIL